MKVLAFPAAWAAFGSDGCTLTWSVEGMKSLTSHSVVKYQPVEPRRRLIWQVFADERRQPGVVEHHHVEAVRASRTQPSSRRRRARHGRSTTSTETCFSS